MSRRARLGVFIAACLVAFGANALAPSPAAAAGPCDIAGKIPVVGGGTQAVCHAAGKAPHAVAHPVQTIQDAAGGVAGAVAQPIFAQLTSWVADGASWLVGKIGGFIDSSTTPRLDSAWFQAQYKLMAALAASLALPLLFLALIEAMWRRHWGMLGQALTAVPLAAFWTVVASALVVTGLQIVDWMCQAASSTAGDSASTFFGNVVKGLGAFAGAGAATGNAGAAGVPLFVGFIAAIFAALSAFAVWVELLLRSSAIYVCVLFFPLVVTARIWPRLERWATRLVEALVAIILSKFVIVAVLSLAAAAIAHGGASEGFSGVLAGAVLLFFAAFAPLVLFRLVQFAESSIHQRQATQGTALQGYQNAAQQIQQTLSQRAAQTRVASGGVGSFGLATATASGGSGGARGGGLGVVSSPSGPGAGGAGGGGGGVKPAGPSGGASGAAGAGAAATGPAGAAGAAGQAGVQAAKAVGERAQRSPGAGAAGPGSDAGNGASGGGASGRNASGGAAPRANDAPATRPGQDAGRGGSSSSEGRRRDGPPPAGR